jgi:hypothetical protein
VIILDTHIWIWWLTLDDRSLKQSWRDAITNADTIAVSAISCSEVAWLVNRGRVEIETGNGGEPVGTLALFDERLIEALHVVERLVRPPRRSPTSWRPRTADARTGRSPARRAIPDSR